MNLPLYKQAREMFDRLSLGKDDCSVNLSLYYQKMCHNWGKDFNSIEKQKFIIDVINKGKVIDKALLDEHIERMYRLVQGLGGIFKIYELQERFITGTGLDHPIEVGFLIHHILGVPYIPGSSIKGLVRDWAENWSQDSYKEIEEIFGYDTGDNMEKRVGKAIFLDALPYGRVNLDADIMTPHYAPYYADGECPGDWNNPVPIPFLTVAEGQRFVFFISPRTKKDVGSCSIAAKWLDGALTTIGAGAKTATGYGCFKSAENVEKIYQERMNQKIEKEIMRRKLANMSPIRREMEDEGYSEKDEVFMESLTVKWIERLEGDENEATKKEIARHLADWYISNRPKQWKNPERKNIEKVETIRRFID